MNAIDSLANLANSGESARLGIVPLLKLRSAFEQFRSTAARRSCVAWVTSKPVADVLARRSGRI
jgi:hypothetical protein